MLCGGRSEHGTDDEESDRRRHAHGPTAQRERRAASRLGRLRWVRRTLRRVALAVLRAAAALCRSPVPRVLDHAEQLHRPVHAGRARPGVAHRRRRAHLVRSGGLRRHRRLCGGLPDADRTASPLAHAGSSGVALAVLAALVLGWVTLRMSGHYLPLATIAWGLALYYTMANIECARQVRRHARHPGDEPARRRPRNRARAAPARLGNRAAGCRCSDPAARFAPGRARSAR